MLVGLVSLFSTSYIILHLLLLGGWKEDGTGMEISKLPPVLIGSSTVYLGAENIITKGSLSYLSSPCFSKNVLQSGVGIVH